MTRDDAVMAYLTDYRLTHGVSPSLSEIASAVGLAGASGARVVLRRLIRAGLVRVTPGSRPGYAVSRGYVPVAP
jgi:SOS-response transcriptional repressor LexA